MDICPRSGSALTGFPVKNRGGCWKFWEFSGIKSKKTIVMDDLHIVVDIDDIIGHRFSL